MNGWNCGLRIAVLLLTIWASVDAVHADEAPGVQFDIFLDSDVLRFPDVVYGLLCVRNMSGEAAYLPKLSQYASINLHLRCEEEVIDGDRHPNDEPHVVQQSAGYFSVTPFRFRYSSPEFILRIREGFPCTVLASIPVRPAEITPKMINHFGGVSLSEDRLEPGNKILHASASADIKIDPKRWIFRNPSDELIRFAAQPAAWRSPAELTDISRGIMSSIDERARHRVFVETGLIEFLPLLSVFPDRVSTIQGRIRCDTATWRQLELIRLLDVFRTNTRTTGETKQVLDHMIRLLRCCGPGELIYLERSASGTLFEPRLPHPGESTDDRVKLYGFKAKYWSDELKRNFPGVPLSGLGHAPDYGDDGSYIQWDQIDIEKLRNIQAVHRAAVASGEVKPCSCRWWETEMPAEAAASRNAP